MKKKKKEIEWKYLALIQLWLYFNLDLCILDFIENRKKNDYLKPFYFQALFSQLEKLRLWLQWSFILIVVRSNI